MRSTIFLILTCQLMSSGLCLFGVRESPTNVTSLQYPKRDSCGLQFGGAIVQLAALPYAAVSAVDWYDTKQCLVFSDRFNATICCYHPDSGKTVSYYVKELENMEIAAIIPVKYNPEKFIIAANQSMYLLTNMPPQNGTWKYSIKKLMDITDDSRILTNAAITIGSQIIIGTKPSNYNANYPNVEKGFGQVILVELQNKMHKVLEDNYTWISDVAVSYDGVYRYHADSKENKIWRRKWPANSSLELVFDMSQYTDTVYGQVKGITLDTDGKLWITLMNSYQVIQFDVNQKRIIRNIPVAAPSVTSISWGGLSYETLYVGTSTKRVNTLAVPAAGTVIGISGTGSRGWHEDKITVPADWLN